MDKVSIIVPVYNTNKYLNKCLDSIINQTYRNLEIILIDDGSTDGSGNICKEYTKKDDRIILKHTENRGLSAARNLGLEIATGEYIAFVDSDDYIENKMIENLYQLIKKYKTSIAVCAYKKDNSSKTKTTKEYIYTTKQALEKLIDYNDLFAISVWNKLYKKELWKDVRFPENRIYEDINTTMKVISKAEKVAYINIPYYFYLQRETSLSRQKYTTQEIDRITNCIELKNFIKQSFPELENQFEIYYLFNKLAVINRMITSNKIDEKLVKELQNEIKKNLIKIIFTKFNFRRKVQLIVCLINFETYKKIYKLGENK